MGRKGRRIRYRPIKNASSIGKGNKMPVINDPQGNRKWVESYNAANKARAPTKPVQVDKALLLKSTTSLTPPSRAMSAAQAQKVQIGASKLIASQKSVKPVVKSPRPVKKAPTPRR